MNKKQHNITQNFEIFLTPGSLVVKKKKNSPRAQLHKTWIRFSLGTVDLLIIFKLTLSWPKLVPKESNPFIYLFLQFKIPGKYLYPI